MHDKVKKNIVEMTIVDYLHKTKVDRVKPDSDQTDILIINKLGIKNKLSTEYTCYIDWI